jgi:hypothetical protein
MQSVGSTIFISATIPATLDAAGFGGATPVWKEVGEVDTIPEYGPETDTITRAPIKTGVKDKQKGMTDYGSFSLDGAYAPGDVGQAALIAASAPTAGAVAVKIQLSDGTLDYCTALVMGYKRTPGASGDFVKFTSKIEIKTPIVTVYPV